MIEHPQTWHHGVIARYWAQFNVAGPEIEYFQRYIERHGDPALDVACGTGRLLVPYLRAGLDVDGCDISRDMLAMCRERAERERLKANLYAQAVHELSSPRKYRTIIFCGGFGLGGYRAHDLEGLRRIHEHLEPGGVLVMDTEVPYASPEWWAYWTKDARRKLPEPWGSTGKRRRGPDGLDYMLRSRVFGVEPIEQRVTLEMHAQLWKQGLLMADEKHELRMTMYFKDEILLMFDKAGFSDVRVPWSSQRRRADVRGRLSCLRRDEVKPGFFNVVSSRVPRIVATLPRAVPLGVSCPFSPVLWPRKIALDMGATAAAAIIGRDDELASLVDVLSNLERLPQTILVEGEAGMGKTTLVRAGIDIAGGLSYRVLSCSPAEAERELSFAGLRDLLDDAYDDAAAELPEPQRRSLAVALLREEPTGGPTDVGAVATAFLWALRRLVRVTPLLVAIDDLHWLDAASMTVLQFAVRRLRDERVALLVAQRTESNRYGPALGRALDEERVRRIGVEGMSLGAAHALLRTRLELSLPRPTLRRLHAAAGGNPLLVLEVGRALKSHEELPAPAEPLPVPATLRELLDVRISNLSPKTRHLLPAIAALSRATMGALDRFARTTGNDAAIDDGVAAGVLALDGARVRFTHPLFATHVYSTLSSSKRRDLHRRLAEIISDAEERARHLALSTETPDEATARALEQAAAAASARGAATTAAELADESRRLTPRAQEEDVWRRTIDAARYHFLAGDAARASDIVTTVVPVVPPGPVRSSALSVLARIKLFTDNLASAVELFAEAAAQPATKRQARAEANEGLAWSLILSRGDARTAARHARIAARLMSQTGDDAAFAETLATQGLSNFLAGKRSGVAAVRRAATVARTAEYSRTVRHPDWALAAALVWSDELSAAEKTIERLHRRALERGDDSSLARILFALSYVQLLKGDWSAARRNAAGGHEVAVETGQQPQAGLLLTSKALVDAHFGDVDAARAWAEQEVGADREDEQRAAAFIHRVVRGFIELSLGNWTETHRQLSPVVERVTSSGIAEPGALWFVPDDIEALVYLKQLDDARRLLEPLERSAHDLKRKSAIAACARCRGLLHAAGGDFSSAAKSFQYALATHEPVGMPFALARTLLAFGIVQRRAKQRRQARALLQQALMTFDSLGASVWSRRAQTELARIAGRRATTTLTATEQRVADLVALGRSNKEVANALFVTVKTVEATLSRIYTKLGIRSRAALVRRFALDQAHDADHGGAAKL